MAVDVNLWTLAQVSRILYFVIQSHPNLRNNEESHYLNSLVRRIFQQSWLKGKF